MFFNAAKRRGRIESNPFEYLVSSTMPNRQRDFFLTQHDTEKLLAACRDAQWHLLVALWRYAGLRKMEAFWLTWSDVLWDEGKLRVYATKTAHHEGKEERYIPRRGIRGYLEDVFEESLPSNSRSLPGEASIITRFSPSNSNLDKPMKVIVRKAGLSP